MPSDLYCHPSAACQIRFERTPEGYVLTTSARVQVFTTPAEALVQLVRLQVDGVGVPDSVLARLAIEAYRPTATKLIQLKRPPIKWSLGAPPSVGWWPASRCKDFRVLRWWNGDAWSHPVSPNASLGWVERCASIIDEDASLNSIYWRVRPKGWPAHSQT